MTPSETKKTGVGLTEAQRDCLEKASLTFGYREVDGLTPIFRGLEKLGLVYQTVRAFYITDAGRAALSKAVSP